MSGPLSPKPTYQSEEAQEILQLALLQRSDGGELSRAQLLEMAEELEIPMDILQVAEQNWLERQEESSQRLAFERDRWALLKQQVGQYAIANGFLVLLNLAVDRSLSWSLYVLLLWGMGLSLKLWQTAQTTGNAYERAYSRWQRRRQLKSAGQKLWRSLQRAFD
ncbi:MAG: 2TM domain-containing protein [Cyanobacteria bacterium J06641_5]